MIEVKYSCDECDNLFEDLEVYIKCHACEKKEEKDLGNYLLDLMEKQKDLTGEWIVGFSSKEEKEKYLRAYNRGIIDASFEIGDYFSLIRKWESIHEKICPKKLEVFWPDNIIE